MTDFLKQFKDKLDKLSNTSQSIQSTSLWVIYHTKNYQKSVDVWKEEILRCSPDKVTTLFYLANDIIQNSRRKTQFFVDAFGVVLKENFGEIHSYFYHFNQENQGKRNKLLG